MPAEIVIGDHNWREFVHDPVVDGQRRRRGLIPRDYALYPLGHHPRGTAFDMPLIPRGEWSDRVKQMEADRSRLSDLRGGIPSRDQDGKGYCWAHSTVSALMLLRARDNQPLADLSAFCIACLIKDYQDEGGWGALSLDWVIQNGCPTSQFWPQQSMSRSNDTPAMRQNAALHRVSETWMEAAAPYDRNLTFDQVATCLLSRIPVVVDYNWWGHSVAACDLVETSPGQFGVRIWNSWGDGWSDRGMGVLEGRKAIPDGACAPRVTAASAA